MWADGTPLGRAHDGGSVDGTEMGEERLDIAEIFDRLAVVVLVGQGHLDDVGVIQHGSEPLGLQAYAFVDPFVDGSASYKESDAGLRIRIQA